MYAAREVIPVGWAAKQHHISLRTDALLAKSAGLCFGEPLFAGDIACSPRVGKPETAGKFGVAGQGKPPGKPLLGH